MNILVPIYPLINPVEGVCFEHIMRYPVAVTSSRYFLWKSDENKRSTSFLSLAV